MCCILIPCIPGTPVEDKSNRMFVKQSGEKFQRGMMMAPFSSCCSFLYCVGQFFPLTMGITQCQLRRQALDYDMNNYALFQGYFNFCCIRGGECGESNCPHLCLFLESCCCNCCAVSATRIYVMEKYDLQSDPCDYRLIRCNNCLQLFACICNVVAIFCEVVRSCARLLDCFANVFYHCLSGCISSQVYHEINYQNEIKTSALVPYHPPAVRKAEI